MSGGMSHIGSGGSGGGSDLRVDGIIDQQKVVHDEVKALSSRQLEIKAKLDAFAATVTDHLSNHPAPATQEMPSPEVINHRSDVHHTYKEALSTDDRADILDAIKTAEQAALWAKSALDSVANLDEVASTGLKAIKEELLIICEILEDIEDEYTVREHHMDKELESLKQSQARLKKWLNRCCIIGALMVGALIVQWIYNAL